MNTTTNMTMSPNRRILGSIDRNSASIIACDEKKSPPNVESVDEKKQAFDLVCKCRVAEDLDGDLEDSGILKWSLDDFELVKKLGSGGTATVFCVKEKQSGYLVALKIQDAGDHALCEIDAHDPLNHPNIVKMIDYFYSCESIDPEDEKESQFEDSDVPKEFMYMIIEICNGGSLHEVIDESGECEIDEAEAVHYIRNAIEALEYVHSHGLVHCDVKPGNFLVHDGVLKLADFGMAVRDDEKEILGGSPVYMAPEHLMAWRHMSTKFDHRVDIYSLGVCLYEMLQGFLPYVVIEDKEEEKDLVSQMADLTIEEEHNFPVLDLRKLNDKTSDEPFYIPPPIFDSLSEEAEDLILRMMEPNQEKRITLAEAKQHPWFKMHGL